MYFCSPNVTRCTGLIGFAFTIACSAAPPPISDGSGATGNIGGSGGVGGDDTAPTNGGNGGAGGRAVETGGRSDAEVGGGGSGDIGGSNEGGGGGTGGSGTGGAGELVAEVFSHSSEVLYRLDPITKAVTEVGPFTNCGASVVDIALNKWGEMYGTTSFHLVAINKVTAVCTPIGAEGYYPVSLSFVPEGTVLPSEEALVGYYNQDYIRIDALTGDMFKIGALSGSYYASGDIVSIIGGFTYLTVWGDGVWGDDCKDCLVQVSPISGQIINFIGYLNHSTVWGLAYWGGVAYGFDADGQLFEIDVNNADTIALPIPIAPEFLSFWGAGSSTAAPHF